MSIPFAAFIFILGLALSIISSLVLAKRIDQLGTWLGLSEGLLGLLTALGADSPEIASAVTAIVGGHHDLGLGVVFGSNIFNLAALLGGSAIVAGCVRVRPIGLWLDGGVGLLVAIIVVARLFGWVGNVVAIFLLALVFPPYLLVSAIKPRHLENWTHHPRLTAFLQNFLDNTAHEKRKDKVSPKPTITDLLGVVPSLAAVILGSVGMVYSAVILADHWALSHVMLGMLVLATLTSIPNVIAALRLALHGRGTAVVSESLNSNNVNLLIGALLPVLIFGTGTLTHLTEMAIIWSIAMTLVALALASFRRGLTRAGGILLLVIYMAYATVVLLWH